MKHTGFVSRAALYLMICIAMLMLIGNQRAFSASIMTEGSETPTVSSAKTEVTILTATSIATIHDPALLPHVGTMTPIATINDPKLLPQALTATPSPYK